MEVVVFPQAFIDYFLQVKIHVSRQFNASDSAAQERLVAADDEA
jgi:hypothetical protein